MFCIPSDVGITTWMSSTDSDYPWEDGKGIVQPVVMSNPKSINGVLRNADMITISLRS